MRPFRRSFRLEQRRQSRCARFSLPALVPEDILAALQAACLSRQEILEIQYGAAECSVCPLANFASKFERLECERINP
jgi:replication-associated recombination protein RarA